MIIDPTVTHPANPYRYLYGKIVRLSYNATDRVLSHPVDLIRGLLAGDNHVGGRLKFGRDKKLYFTAGDQITLGCVRAGNRTLSRL